MKIPARSLALIVAMLAIPVATQAQQAVGLTSASSLLSFDASAPGNATATVALTGLGVGETLVGLDYRPFNRTLVGVTSLSRLVIINPTSGATSTLSTLSVALAGTAFGVDFNPLADRLRIVSNTGQSLRVNVETGAATVDGSLAFATTDINTGVTPLVAGAAYTNSLAGRLATSTTLYDLDYDKDVLVRQDPPNNGTLATLGALGVDFTANAGLDIFSPTLAFASNTTGGASSLYQVNLATGAATLAGAFAAGLNIVDFALVPKESPQGIINTSARGMVSPGEGAVIAGFVVTGNGPANVLVTTRGPTLTQFGVTNALSDTRVALYRGNALIEQNDDWQSHARVTEITNSGYAPMSAKEAAVLVSLAPGAYTAVVSGAGTATTGVTLVEVYEMP